MISNPTTTTALLSIEHDGPVYVRELGTDNPFQGEFKPDSFEKLIGYINRNGGPQSFTIDPIA